MSISSNFAVALALALTSAALPAAAQPGPAAQTAATPASAETSEGEVRKVDREAGKLTLRHGPIKNLDMPGMTMVFHVTDLKLLENLKPGDKVRFVAASEGGRYLVTELRPAGQP
jgi:Cu/Ag efflux protein CusF